MGQAKYTPGPWRSDEHFSCHSLIIAPGNNLIAHLDCKRSGSNLFLHNAALEIDRANAKLIAAAPELLEACEQALNAFRNDFEIDWNALEDAIQKAKGAA